MEPESEYSRRQSLAVPQQRPSPNPTEHPPAPNFETRIDRSGSSDVEEQHFLIPRSSYYSVVACTGYTMDQIETRRYIPVPTKPFRYSLEEFYGTFLQELISQSDLVAFLSEVSRETTTAVREESKESNDSGSRACFSCGILFVLILIVVLSVVVKSPWPIVILFLVFPFCCCFSDMAKTNARINFVTRAQSKLTRVIQEKQHQLLSRGILARPGNYGAFVQFIQGYRN